MSRLLSLFLEYINIVTGVLIIMSSAALAALVVGEPGRGDGLLLAVLVVLIIITVVNGIIAALMSARRHLADIQTNEIRQVELLRTITTLNDSIDIEARKRQDW